MLELKIIVDNLPIAILVVDRERRILLANRIAKKIACVDPWEIYARRFGDVLGCPNANENAAGCGFSKFCHLCQVKSVIDRAFTAKKSIPRFETNTSTDHMGVRDLRMTVTYIHADEHLTSEQEICIVTVEDMTEFKKKERMVAANETIGAICHEMNQPLQAIMGNVELLTEFRLEDGAVSRINKILSEIERIKDMNIKLMNITHYQSKPYLSSSILDVEKSAGKTTH